MSLKFVPRNSRSDSSQLFGKYRVSQPGDPLEKEADQTADQIMRMPALTHAPCTARSVGDAPCPACTGEQRGAAFEAGGVLHRQPIEEEEMQLKQLLGASASPVTGGSKSTVEAVRIGGSPLPAPVRSYFEPRFGADLSGVRVHTGQAAAQATSAVSARAFTLGNSIAFAPGQFDPGGPDGRRLLAHELVHVMQQRGVGMRPTLEPIRESRPFRTSVVPDGMSAVSSRITTSAAPMVQRKLFTRKELEGMVNDLCPTSEDAGDFPESCKCMNKALNGERSIVIREVSFPHTLRIPQGSYFVEKKIQGPVTVPDPTTNIWTIYLPVKEAYRGEFGFFDILGMPHRSSFQRLLIHELCGHAISERQLPRQSPEKGNRPGHDSAIGTANAIVKEQSNRPGGDPFVERGLFEDIRQGESFRVGEDGIIFNLRGRTHTVKEDEIKLPTASEIFKKGKSNQRIGEIFAKVLAGRLVPRPIPWLQAAFDKHRSNWFIDNVAYYMVRALSNKTLRAMAALPQGKRLLYTLIVVMKEGWTTSKEQEMIDKMFKALNPTDHPPKSPGPSNP